LARTLRMLLALRPSVVVSEGVRSGSCDPASPARATEPAIKMSIENIRFISFSQCRSRPKQPDIDRWHPRRRNSRSRGRGTTACFGGTASRSAAPVLVYSYAIALNDDLTFFVISSAARCLSALLFQRGGADCRLSGAGQER
jgi:hypothetical protein